MMTILFWLAASIVAYTFLGYPLLIDLLARLRPRPNRVAAIEPSVTLIIPAYNEEAVIAAKIENSLALDYTADKLAILVVADGSDDDTVTIAGRYPGVMVAHRSERRGKAAAVNRVMPAVTGDIILFSDANTLFAPGTLRAMVRHFADPSVGGVTGEKRVQGGGEGLYWRYESWLKARDSRVTSVMGAAGEIFALRRQAFQPPEEDSIIEDFILSMRLVAGGWRVIYEPAAVAFEPPAPSLAADWQRRTRIAAGGFQSIARLPELLDPRRGLVAWQYVSHRALRWAVTPFMLPLLLLLNLLLWPRRLYRPLLLGQLGIYALGLLGYRDARRGRSAGLAYGVFYFLLANLAAITGFLRLMRGRQPVTWRKVRK
ncbi:MAG: glycosyltransferase family 2 protein [Chloroflexota bacterium]|jgi:cellulose synthase/poly-beta-1,6-N-acetylglucosamine synthase-like glycosyltransferase